MSTEIIEMFHNLDERMSRLEAKMEQMIKMVASTIQNQTELGKRIDQLNEKISMNFKIEIISQEQILTNYKINAFQHTLTSFDKKN